MTVTYDYVKRGIDIVVGGTALLASAPLQGVVAALLWKQQGSPILFKQPRPGKDGKVFNILKFRTMLPVTPERQTDEERLTPLGKFLRSTSIDELPALINVVRGDMSLVGPRPLLVRYLDRYTPEQARRHEVRPGITGLAQANGRNLLSWEDRFRMDVEYVDNRSFALDCKIVWDTVAAVLRRTGISEEGGATMSEFMGSADIEGAMR